MKKINILLALVVLGTQAMAQVDRSKPPKSGPAPVIQYADPTTFTLPNGMTVMVVENHKLPRVSATLTIDQGPIKEGAKAGVVQLMGAMLSEGTTTMSKAQFDEAVDLIGADVSLNPSGAYVGALTRYFEKAFMLMSEGIRNPSFPQESFDKLKKQAITALKSGEKSASTISNRVVSALSYGKNTALGEFQTEESINSITLNDIKEYYRNYITPSRSYLIFVGDITPGMARTIASKAFGTWKGRKLELPSIPNADNVKTTEINFVDVPTAVQGEITITNLINNPMTNPDYHALLIANQILGGGFESKLFMNLREKHGFTYGSYSSVGSSRFQSRVSATAQVRSEKADSAIVEMLREIENMRKGNITQEELDLVKAKYNGSFALGMEDPARAATHASNIMINNLPKDFYRTFLQKINALTVKDIQRVANKYFQANNSRIIIAGNGDKILPNLTRLGYPIKKYDKYANPITDEPADKNVDETPKTSEAISAFSVVEGYLKAIGGKEEAKKVNSIVMEFDMEMMGMPLTATMKKMNPDKEYFQIVMQGNTVMQRSFDGTKGYMAQMGQKKDMDEKEIKESLDSKGIFPQLNYIGSEYKTSYTGTGKVGNETAYKLKITRPSGKVAVEYYSTKTGLLLREESTIEQGGQEMAMTTDFLDYTKAGNVMVPGKLVQTVGPQEITMTLKSVKVNEGVSADDFK